MRANNNNKSYCVNNLTFFSKPIMSSIFIIPPLKKTIQTFKKGLKPLDIILYLVAFGLGPYGLNSLNKEWD